jgi:hypothetical protein
MPAAGDAKYTLLHAEMYPPGDKYGVVGLKHLVAEKFIRACGQFCETEQFALAFRAALTSTLESDCDPWDIAASTVSESNHSINQKSFRSLFAETPHTTMVNVPLEPNPGKDWRSVLAELNYKMEECEDQCMRSVNRKSTFIRRSAQILLQLRIV